MASLLVFLAATSGNLTSAQPTPSIDFEAVERRVDGAQVPRRSNELGRQRPDQRDPPPALSTRLPPPKQVDARRVAAAGIRYLDGKHLRLFTDVPSSPAVDELPKVFDAAVPLWAEHFKLPPERVESWHVQGFLVADRERFAALDLLPRDNPIFINGYSHAAEFWLMEQASDYYRRHLLLHEGTHAFMYAQLGGAGPGWFMEGMAELLGTHEWDGQRLSLGVVPKSNAAAPLWGRTKLVRDAVADGRTLPIDAILHFDNRRSLSKEQYAWTWALTALLDRHPKYQARFRSLRREAANPRFNDRFRELFGDDWGDLNAEWQAYLASLDYGYDVEAMAMVHRPAIRVGERGRSAEIIARGGWQSTGFLLTADCEYELTAEGRFQIADPGQPWVSEPGGVTIDYHDGHPLGMLLGALQPTRPSSGRERSAGRANAFGASDHGSSESRRRVDPDFFHPLPIGLRATVKPSRDSVLYVRVNDSPGKLGDNAGEVIVRAQQVE